MENTKKMPLLFLGHGSPMNAIEENEFVLGFRNIARDIPRPKAILCISAHWETRGTKFTSSPRPKTIYDFYGFPKELYEVEYPAPGNPDLALKAKELTNKYHTELDQHWGLDHGAWSVIKHMYPDANIPVIQMSLDKRKDPQYHYELAKEIEALRMQGILIVGSGNLVHNLKMIDWKNMNKVNHSYDWAAEAREKMNGFILNGDHNSLIKYSSLGKEFNLAIPTPEHFLPLLYILSLKGKNEQIDLFNDKAIGGSITMTSLKIS